MLNDLSSPLALLATRRSAKPRDMVEPGPDPAQLRRILEIAMRVPDHGKLAPWRFVIVNKDRRAAFAEILRTAYLIDKPSPGRLEIEANEAFAHQAPCLIVALSSPRESHIPRWEQQLSAGAACMTLLAAAHASGFVGCWLTGWAAYSEAVRDAFGKAPERIAGFIFLGSPGKELEERPRPEYGAVVGDWPCE